MSRHGDHSLNAPGVPHKERTSTAIAAEGRTQFGSTVTGSCQRRFKLTTNANSRPIRFFFPIPSFVPLSQRSMNRCRVMDRGFSLRNTVAGRTKGKSLVTETATEGVESSFLGQRSTKIPNRTWALTSNTWFHQIQLSILIGLNYRMFPHQIDQSTVGRTA